MRVLFALILSVIITTGSVMNLLVVVVIYKNKSIRQHIASLLIANLAVIDLLHLLFVMPFSAETLANGEWTHSKITCKVNGFFGTTFSLASILMLAMISLDRWAAIMKPLLYKARMTTSHAVKMDLYVWVQAAIFAAAPLPHKWYISNMHYGSCDFPSIIKDRSFTAYMCCSMALNIFVPLVIILVTYFYVFRIARSHSRRIAIALVSIVAVEHEKVRKETIRQRETRIATKIFFIILAVMVCHLPYSIIRLLEMCMPSTILSLPQAFLVSMKWLVYLKSAVNPFLYSLIQKRYRTALIELFETGRQENTRTRTISKTNFMRETQSNHDELAGNVTKTALPNAKTTRISTLTSHS